MKTIFKAIMFFVCSICTFSMSAQDFEMMLKNKEYSKIAQYLDTNVSIQIDQTKTEVDKNRAIQILKQNLDSFRAVKFEKLHQGASNEENANYLIIKMFNSKNESVRIFFHLESKSNQKKVTAIRIR